MITRKFVSAFLTEFGPIIGFFLGTELVNFYVGTAILVAGSAIALGFSLVVDGRVPIFSLVSSFFVLLFGGLTLYLHDAKWLVLEYTLYNAVFGVGLLVGLAWKKCYLKPLFVMMFHISDRAWRILSLRWAFFFLVTAVLNEFVWRTMGEHSWIYFRVAAGIGLAIFGFSQFFLARKERHPDASPWGLRM